MSKHYGHHNHYDKLHIPDHWEHYWSKYPNGYTLLEALISWTSQVNDMIVSYNHMSDDMVALDRNFRALDKELRASWKGYKDHTEKTYTDFREELFTILNNWIATIEPTIQDTVVSSLSGWLTDGTLADIINNDVFNMKANQSDLEHIQNDRAISPDDFEGSDFEKVQSAIDEAIESKKAIRLARVYNVTNSTPLKLNKKNTRWTLNFIGEGGGFLKTNSGFMFDSDNDLSADINFTSVVFEGIAGSGMTLFNGDKRIILNTTMCSYYSVDKKISSTNYIQSLRSLNDRVTGGQGYFISTPSAFDYLDEGTLCEVRESYFEQTVGDPNKPYHQLYSARFTGGTIEGLTGTAIKVLNTENLLIDGMYIEQNDLGNIVFDDDGVYYGVTITNNFSHSAQSNPTPLINWGGTIYNAKAENNHSNNSPVHDARLVTSGYILSYRDVSAYKSTEDLDPNKRILKRDGNPIYDENGLKTKVTVGGLVKMTSRVEQQTLQPGYNSRYTVPFDSEIYLDDIISVQIKTTGSRDITYHYIRDVSDKKNLIVTVANRSEEDSVVSIYATVLKFDRGGSLIG